MSGWIRNMAYGTAFATALAMGGCAPMGGHYYRPSAITGTVVRPYCHDKIGPESVIRFSFPSSYLEVSADASDKSTVYINVLASGSTFADLKVDVNSIAIYDDATHSEISKTDIKERAFKQQMAYSFDIAAAPQQFRVHIPRLQADGEHADDLDITFKREFEFWIEVLNC